MAGKQNPAKAEARGDNIKVHFSGVDYTISREVADDVELYERLEDGNYVTGVRTMLGSEQWQAFKDAHRVDGRVPMKALNEFLDAAMSAVGNAGASSGS